MGIIRFILIFVLVYYVIRFVVKRFLPLLLNKFIAKHQPYSHQQSKGKKQPYTKKGNVTIYGKAEKNSKYNNMDGDYVDFEEVDDK